jgi:hypothetical protein
MADFLRKVLPDYTAERQSKMQVQQSDTPTEIPPVVPMKHETSDNAEDETIDLRELDKPPRFLDTQYCIRKDGDTLIIGNSTVDVDEPGVITVRGNGSY